MRIKKKMVAIISVMLILVTAISFSAFMYPSGGMEAGVYAESGITKTAEKTKEKDKTKEEDKTKADKEKSEEKTKEEKTKEEKTKEDKEKTEKKTQKENKEKSEEKTDEADNKKEKEKEEKNSDKKSDKKEDKSKKDSEDKKSEKDKKNSKKTKTEEKPRKWTMNDITSSSYIVISGSTSEVIREKHSSRKMSPGNMTQLVTAMVVIDNIHNPAELTDNKVEITRNIASFGDTYREGESVAVGDLLDMMLICGDRESAEALASYSTSTRDIFIREMNSKAMALELMDTQFDNPTGLYSTAQYSTARECATITQAAFRYPYIRNALGQNDISFTVYGKDGNRTVASVNTNPLMTSRNKDDLYKDIRGGMLGFLGQPVNSAQYAGVSESDDMQLIAVLMDSQLDMVPKEAGALLDYGSKHVTRNVIVEADKAVGHAKIHGGDCTIVKAYTAAKGFAYVPPEGSEELIQHEIVMSTGLEAPMKAGTKVGEYRIYVADELKGTVDLVIKRDISKGWFLSRIYISNRATVIICAILVIILLIRLRMLHVKRTQIKRREARRQRRIRELARQQMAVDEDRRRREWNYDSSNYDSLPPRTTDIRKAAIEEALRKEQEDKAVSSGSKTDKRRIALRKKAEQKRDRNRDQKRDQKRNRKTRQKRKRK